MVFGSAFGPRFTADTPPCSAAWAATSHGNRCSHSAKGRAHHTRDQQPPPALRREQQQALWCRLRCLPQGEQLSNPRDPVLQESKPPLTLMAGHEQLFRFAAVGAALCVQTWVAPPQDWVVSSGISFGYTMCVNVWVNVPTSAMQEKTKMTIWKNPRQSET